MSLDSHSHSYQLGALDARRRAALDLAARYGSIDVDHHKMWVIDQMVRRLTGGETKYLEWLARTIKPGHTWHHGIAP